MHYTHCFTWPTVAWQFVLGGQSKDRWESSSNATRLVEAFVDHIKKVTSKIILAGSTAKSRKDL
jgi:hypothetical protein